MTRWSGECCHYDEGYDDGFEDAKKRLGLDIEDVSLGEIILEWSSWQPVAVVEAAEVVTARMGWVDLEDLGARILKRRARLLAEYAARRQPPPQASALTSRIPRVST